MQNLQKKKPNAFATEDDLELKTSVSFYFLPFLKYFLAL